MTITSVQSLLPGRIASNSAEKQTAKPPPQLHGITDFPFKGYHPPQPEGYQQSQAHPDISAIVIDNGKVNQSRLSELTRDSQLTYVPPAQVLISSRPAGHLIKPPDSPYPLS